MTLDRFLYRMFYTSEGLFGPIATISATYVFMFILFAAFLLKSGAGGDFIVDVANAVAGKYTGGTGHVAVISSAMMGTISGSAVANTVSTGSITIPMMKKKQGSKVPLQQQLKQQQVQVDKSCLLLWELVLLLWLK